MVNNQNGDFGANFEIPQALPGVKNPAKKISNLYTGKREFTEHSDDMLVFEAPVDTQPIASYASPEQLSIFGDDLPWRVSAPNSNRHLQTNTTAPQLNLADV